MSATLICGADAVMAGRAGPDRHAGALDMRIRDGVVTGPAGCVGHPAWVNTDRHLAQTLLDSLAEGWSRTLADIPRFVQPAVHRS
jgi:cytosine/adenosine deaminase-related metal-dependent hydrolase